MKPTSHRYGIVLYPPSRISKLAIKTSAAFAKKSGLFTLGKKDFYPHVTIYTSQFPDKNIPKITKLLSGVARNTNMKSTDLKAKKYRQLNDNYIDVAMQSNPKILKLQKKIVEVLNPLRDGLITKESREQLEQTDGVGRKNITRYGSQHVFSKYHPHLTLTKLSNNRNGKNYLAYLKNTPCHYFSFTATSLGLFMVGDYGACRKLIKKFSLK